MRSILWTALLSSVLATSAGAASTAPLDAEHPGAILPDRAPERGPDGDLLDPPPMMPGWPQMMGTHPNYAPVGIVLSDLDKDGDLEVVAGSTDGRLYVWEHDGTPLPGWPIDVGNQIQSKGAVADLDGDGDREILVAVKSGQLQIYHHDATPLAGWPQATGFSYGFLSPVVYDLDGDRNPEVLIGGGGMVRAWSADGTPFPGWPQAVSGNVSGTLAVGDVDNDAVPEIFAVSSSGELYGFRSDGTQIPGWPAVFGLSSSWAAPSIGDVDHDGSRDVLVVGYSFGAYTQVFAFAPDATPLTGWPVTYPSAQTYSCPVLADVDGDDDLEIFNAGKINGPTFYAWDHTGAILPGWPAPADPNMEGSAIVLDFDGAAGPEIAIGDNYTPGEIYGYNVDGTVAADFPIPKPGASLPNSPEVGDVEDDGDLDMGMTMGNGAVALWDVPIPYDPRRIEWGALFHDDWNTNQYGFLLPGEVASVGDGISAGPVRLAAPFPNPLRPETAIPVACAREARVRLTVHDLQGRTVRILHAGTLSRGEHRIGWGGLDEAGRPVPAGIYFLRLESGGPAAARGRIQVIR